MNGKNDRWFDGDTYISAFTLGDFLLGVSEMTKNGAEIDFHAASRAGDRYRVPYKVNSTKKVEESSQPTEPYSREALEALAEGGISNLREIGKELGVKSTSKKELIELILSAQSEVSTGE